MLFDHPSARLPRDYQPSVESPLVFHLHGSLRYPASLVLAERDYHEFLINLVLDRGMDDQRMIPMPVLQALTRKPLLFIGYSLRDWSFRMLFKGLLESVPDVQRRRHVSVQLPLQDDEPDREDRASDYVAALARQLNTSLYWGSPGEFTTELSRRLEAV